MHASPNQTNKLTFYLIPQVWLFADSVFFVEYGGKSLIKVGNCIIPKVYLWELEVCQIS